MRPARAGITRHLAGRVFLDRTAGADPVPATLVLEEEGSTGNCSKRQGLFLLRPFIAIGFLTAATGAFADPVPLANDELKTTVSGSVVEIDTPVGSTVSMRFGTDGLVSAEAGVLAPVLGAAKDRGRWWVEGDKLCTKWFRWFDAGVRCLTIARDGSRIYWRKIDDGETGTGTLIGQPAKEPKAPVTPTVVAKAEPAPEKKAVPDGTYASRLAGPPREAPADSAPHISTPVVVARAEAAPSSTETSEDPPAMPFGAGLASAAQRADEGVQAPATGKAPHLQATAALPEKAPRKTSPAKAKDGPAKTEDVAIQYRAAAATLPPARKAPTAKSAAATSSSRTVALYRVIGVEDYDVLNVRRGPSEDHVSIAAIPPQGRQVEITGQCKADWCPIKYGAVKGWVNRYYLAEEGSRENVYATTRR